MKLFVYSCREFDEKEYFIKFSKQFGIEIGICTEAPTLLNAQLAQGYPYISILTNKIDKELMEELYSQGVRYISTRTIGYDHIDLIKAKELGIQISNATYSPDSVADYTLMLMLMVNRKAKRIMERAAIQDFTLPGIQGREMHNMTVGIIGTGRIGTRVIEELQGFGCKILAYDYYQNERVKELATYVNKEELFKKSDIISLHMPASEDNHHMINRKAIAKMKKGVILINTARGSLIDTKAMLDGLEQGHLGGAGLDVVEREFGLYYYDRKSDVLENRELAILRSYPNVVVTPHMAFYTDQAISDMVYSSVASCYLDNKGEENPFKIEL